MPASHQLFGRSLGPRFSRSVLVTLALGVLAACGNASDRSVSAPAAANTAAADTDPFDVALDTGVPVPDVPAQPDVPAADQQEAGPASKCPGGPGCACAQNGDCNNAICIEDATVAGGKSCARGCVDSCPSGYQCAQSSGSSGDVLSICVPKFGHLCDPCSASADCASVGLKDTACVDEGSLGRFCGVACSGDGDCPADYACQEVPTAEGGKLKQCTKKPDGQQQPFGVCPCSGAAVQKKTATVCYVEVKDAGGQLVGKCSGVRTCTAAGLSACAAPEAKVEVCNGEDDDCDGQTDEASCDDAKPCTQDVCDGKNGCLHKPLDGQPCDADGSVCTEGDGCQTGACVAGGKKDCDDKNPCTQDSCDLAKGCTHTDDDGKPCDADGSACTAGDVCQTGQCVKGQALTCDDGNPCTVDACDPKTGQCGASPEEDGIPCDDGTKCTSKDACSGGVCKGKAVNCDDDNPCTDDVCDKALGCSPTSLTGSPCNDGNPCTVGDACKDGACDKGKPKVCDFSDTCKPAACDVVDGQCKFKNAKNGSACDDGSACTDKDACLDGACDSVVLDCNDNNPCTTDSCDAKSGCTSGPNSSPCSDGNACTQLDKCTGGKCAGQPLDIKLDCDDGNVCTTDSCEPKAGCTHAVNQLACDDGNPCTQGDLCAAKACQAGSNVCGCEKDVDCAGQEDGDLCNGSLFCDTSKLPYACKVKATTIVTCDVSKDATCATNQCTPATGKCGMVSVSDGKDCDADGSVCTVSDACAGGACKAGSKVGCDDQNPCTTDSCDAKVGCQHLANTAPCDADGNPCTANDTCQDKVCIAGSKKVCDDGQFCTVDGCDKTSGKCVFDAAPQQGKTCDADGSVCTVGDACAQGTCAAGAQKVCDDSNVCTDDSCDAKTGCVTIANAATCTDGNACTDKDVCTGGSCQGKVVSCDDGNPCTDDSCDKAKGCAQLPNSVTCSDGNACTAGDICGGGKCAGAAVTCDDNNPCTTDSCDPQTGCKKANLADKTACSTDGNKWCMSGTCVAKDFCFQPRVDLTGTGAPFGLAAGDFDGDGDIDLAVATDIGSAIAIRMNDGTGKFPNEVTYPAPYGTRYVEAGDLNGDGKLDLVATKFDSYTLSVFVNKGDGTFKAGVDWATGKSPYDLRIGDLDGDGDNDVAVACEAAHAIWVHWNNGTGNLSSTKSIDVTTTSQWNNGATAPDGVALGDFNGDGKLDIACANTGGSNASVIINQGGGNFAQPVHLAVGAQPFAIEVADVSADGKLDLVVANLYSHDVSILLGNGAGGFGSQKKYATGQTPMWRMRVVDLDGDGDADVIVPNYLSNSVSILANNGDGTFAAKKDYAVGSKPGTVVAADFDGNGAADFAVGSTAEGVGGFKGISVFLGCGGK